MGVSLQHLLPHYKKREPLDDSDDEWDEQFKPAIVSMLKAVVSMANSSAAAAEASAKCTSAASSLATISLSMLDRKRRLGVERGMGWEVKNNLFVIKNQFYSFGQ